VGPGRRAGLLRGGAGLRGRLPVWGSPAGTWSHPGAASGGTQRAARRCRRGAGSSGGAGGSAADGGGRPARAGQRRRRFGPGWRWVPGPGGSAVPTGVAGRWLQAWMCACRG